ncbi:hypothetical protein ACOME3_005313 [Neoechinorhynchus agilis]
MDKTRRLNVLPDKEREVLLSVTSSLPSNYDFELEKSILSIRRNKCKRVAIQMPEGLMRYACTISLTLESFTDADVIILSDVTYGACCIDDTTAQLLGCDLLIHYGHSCLIPTYQMDFDGHVLYVFVRIKIDAEIVAKCLLKDAFIENEFKICCRSKLALVSTVQFISCLRAVKARCKGSLDIIIPQTKPLSSGEILGCTAPTLKEPVDAVVCISDGRFHLEAMMIANPGVPTYRFDPYSRKFTIEHYDNKQMITTRMRHIEVAENEEFWILVVSLLGRQGSTRLVDTVANALCQKSKKHIKVAMSELNPNILQKLFQSRVFVHVSCPRLSTDWCSQNSDTVFLNAFEALVALGKASCDGINYPMQYYSRTSEQPYNVNAHLEDKIKKECQYCLV